MVIFHQCMARIYLVSRYTVVICNGCHNFVTMIQYYEYIYDTNIMSICILYIRSQYCCQKVGIDIIITEEWS